MPSCGCKVQISMQANSLQTNSEVFYHHMKAATLCAWQLLSMPLDENAHPVQSNLVVGIPACSVVRTSRCPEWRERQMATGRSCPAAPSNSPTSERGKSTEQHKHPNVDEKMTADHRRASDIVATTNEYDDVRDTR